MINLQITDARTGQVIVVQQTVHDAKKHYLALRELFGDAQTGARPGELITVPPATLKIPGRVA